MTDRDLRAAGITDPRLRAAYERVPSAERRARPDLLPRDPAAAAGQAAARARALRLRALRRRARRRPRPPTRPPWSAGPTGSSPTSTGGDSDAPGQPGRRSTPRAPGASPVEHFEAFLASRCGWTSPSPATRRTPTSSATCTASAAVIGLQMVPILEPLDAARHRATPARSARPSSCRTSSATSARTCAAAGSTCRQEDLDRFGVTRADLAPGPTPPHVRDAARASRSPAPGRSTPRPSPASRCCTRPAATASAPPSCCTAASWTRSRRRGYQVLDRRVAVPLPPPAGRRAARPCVRARRSASAGPAEPPAPPHPPGQRLHAPARSRTAGPRPARTPAARRAIAGPS